MREYERRRAKGKDATKPEKPDPYAYEIQLRTKVDRRVTFKGGKVVSWEDPHDQYLDDWH